MDGRKLVLKGERMGILYREMIPKDCLLKETVEPFLGLSGHVIEVDAVPDGVENRIE